MLQEIDFLNYIHLAEVINEYAYFKANVSSKVVCIYKYVYINMKIKRGFLKPRHIQKFTIIYANLET